ncbi:MAG: hypothetical protein IJB49_06785, partial [Clostridia bacterium]|nr:hypothetical protein [Clostridia bacterium]
YKKKKPLARLFFLSRGAEKDAHDFIIKMLFDQREKGYLFFSLFSLISSLEKSRGGLREK